MAALNPAVPPAPTFAERGFTLTEMAVVLVIVALLIGGMILPLAAQQDIRNVAATQKQIADAIEALHGFAASRSGAPHLPCPDTDGDGRENRAGADCAATEGALPWADLGLGRQDAWGNALRYAVAPAFANSTAGFGLLTLGALRICAEAACTNVIATNLPAVVFSRGKNGASEQAPAGTPPTFYDRVAASGYDDVVAWLPAPILTNRMVAAGKLP